MAARASRSALPEASSPKLNFNFWSIFSYSTPYTTKRQNKVFENTELPRLIKEKSGHSHNHIKNMIFKIYYVRFSG
ncbi:uncharacterized protein LOC126619617 isoform X3 [Malus sylvestris]|uniref:uncharacterized protein LOC126619617 isoform X3 n=1 Tax=Malus sylvestris TaxID=3752 RepID=UPI0021ABDD6E|nr:uncharacterized protein LOC126619617 isoform X3 [Malus sylvestris]